MSNNLPHDRRVLAIQLLCEGMGIRPLARSIGCHHETLIRLGRDVGEGYARLHDLLMVRLPTTRLELDEAWSFVHTKQGHLDPGDPKDWGDQYSFIALDAVNKAIVAYHVGKRTKANTIGFALDIAARLLNEPQITSDGFESYVDAIRIAFGEDADYAMLIKEYRAACAIEAAIRYQSADVRAVERKVVSGEPEEDLINTAFVERQNLTLRMLTRRFNRLTNGHSKLLRNHRAAMDLHVGYYNLCRPHLSLRGRIPAMTVGATKAIWSVDRFVQECHALSNPAEPPIRPGDEHYTNWLRDQQQAKRARRIR